MTLVLPVIHHVDAATTSSQAELAAVCGADGFFLISHGGDESRIASLAAELKQRHPDRLVGISLLNATAPDAWDQARDLRLDTVWLDDPGIDSAGLSPLGRALVSRIGQGGAGGPQVFASVAFKSQREETDPVRAADIARTYGAIPTTSGPATGKAPTPEKIAAMAAGGPLAVASGMTVENIRLFLPYLSHILVATGVSRDFHHFDEGRLREFVRITHSG